ncbi:MAG: GTP pyrophosphokinase family protein [Oscillospiraceae bacterium]|nr:GTP pyrophosphokinase family protein [Oscillospiraceae bacterium]
MLIEKMSNHDLRLAMLPYSSALKVITMHAETIMEELFANRRSNPVEHIKSRLKRPSSIARKLEKKGYRPSVENALKYIDDIAGVRFVCLFPDDIYKIAEVIRNFNNIRICRIKDYIERPKPNGYRSYHMHVEVPIRLLDHEESVKVEIQIRTVAMDSWASMEHKIRYKKGVEIPDTVSYRLLECAHLTHELDKRMQELNEEINKLSPVKQPSEQLDTLEEYFKES